MNTINAATTTIERLKEKKEELKKLAQRGQLRSTGKSKPGVCFFYIR